MLATILSLLVATPRILLLLLVLVAQGGAETLHRLMEGRDMRHNERIQQKSNFQRRSGRLGDLFQNIQPFIGYVGRIGLLLL